MEDEERAITNANKRIEIAKARMEVVRSAQNFIQMTRQDDPEGEGEFLQELTEAVEKLKELEKPEPVEGT